MPWWVQRTYLEGLADDPEVPVVLDGMPTTPGGTDSLDPFADISAFDGFGVSTTRG